MKNNKIYTIFIALFLPLLFLKCGNDSNLMNFDNTPRGNFDALWTILDENYCFFDYKNIDWNSVRESYSSRIDDNMDSYQLFIVLQNMLMELKDGHVNLISAHDMSRYWNWSEDYKTNFDSDIQRNYLGKNYGIASGMRYSILKENIGYIYYESFAKDVGGGNISEVLNKMAICKGIIIDIRSNGGGNLLNVDKIASRFFNEKTLVGYISHKNGKGHSDFSSLYPKYIDSYDGFRYQKTVVVLTNRGCYSAANDFVNVMKSAPKSFIVGDKTGGGGGLPFSSELPNGWSVRYSASPMFDVEKQHIEFGIEPDIRVDMLSEDKLKGLDTIIEKAKEIIEENS